MPLLKFGTWPIENNDNAPEATLTVLKLGYRLPARVWDRRRTGRLGAASPSTSQSAT